jgi:hypothetical protein
VLKVLNSSYNQQDLFMNYSVFTPKIESSFLNVTLFTFQKIHSMEAFITMSAPEFKGDKHFQALVLRTRVDFSSIMINPGTLLMQKPILDAIIKSLDFELRFPLAKVSKLLRHFKENQKFFFQGNLPI